MDRLTRYLAAGIIGAAVLSCSKGGDITVSPVHYSMIVPCGQIDSIDYSVNYEFELVDKAPSKALAQAYNHSIATFIVGEGFEGAIDDGMAALLDSLKAEYIQEANDVVSSWKEQDMEDEEVMFPYWSLNWYLDVKGGFAGSRGNVTTYFVKTEVFQGGAHGMYTYIPYNLNTRTGKQITIDEFFLPGYEMPLTNIIAKHLYKQLDKEDLFEDPTLVGDWFSVEEEGLKWHYQPYDIAPYAVGLIEVLTPWEDLGPFINQETTGITFEQK